MTRALAHIEKIEWVKPIEGADNIELIGILGWICIARKLEFKEGDKAVYIEVDSLCPNDDKRFAFLEPKKYRVKTLRLGKFNVISQGLALPIEEFPELKNKDIGDDVTEQLKITYYSPEDRARKSNGADPNAKYKAMMQRHKKLFKKPIMRKIMKTSVGKKIMFAFFGKKNDKPTKFPNWIVKTDEIRVENIPWVLDSEDEWIVTEKLDGTSCTFAVDRLKKGKNKFDFIVCSRNVRQKDRNQETFHDSNVYWELADKYEIEKILTDFAVKNDYDRVVIQGEGIGKVQGNPYKLSESDLYVFNLVINGTRCGTIEMAKFCDEHGLRHVPIIEGHYILPDTMEEFKLEADGYSVINPKVRREGFVYRKPDGQFSFKSVSREYLIRHHQ